jgi:hypothetical protein
MGKEQQKHGENPMRKKIIGFALCAMLFARCIPDSVSKGHGAAQRWRNP